MKYFQKARQMYKKCTKDKTWFIIRKFNHTILQFIFLYYGKGIPQKLKIISKYVFVNLQKFNQQILTFYTNLDNLSVGKWHPISISILSSKKLKT